MPPHAERRGQLVQFNFGSGPGTGFGFIKPVTLDRGADGPRQNVFFHVNDWVGSNFDVSKVDLPLAVRYFRVEDRGARANGSGKWKAVSVSRLG